MADAAIDYDFIAQHLTPEERAEFDQALAAQVASQVFWPNPGPQTLAMNSEADIIGYGGAAGGGKSYLIAGLTTMHKRTSITRPQKNQTLKFVEEIAKMIGTRDGYSSQTSTFRFHANGDERLVKFFGLDNPGDEEKQQGDDYDLKAYDEVTQMRESDIRYTLTWNRTDLEGQRVRALLTFNPPTTPEGRWVIKFFAPWIDPNYPGKRAKEGELRWFATVGDNQDFEVAGPQPFIVKRNAAGELRPFYSFRPSEHPPEEIVTPKSRTFIRARVTDNPYYMKTGYIAQLQSLPEPLRSQMLNGDFQAGVEDAANQLIPTEWIYAAQERWRQREPLYRTGAAKKGPMDGLGVDVARGGNMGSTLGATGHDELVIAPRYGTFFDKLITHKGVAIDDGAKSAALIIAEIRDLAPVHVDVIGVGTSTYDFLNQNNAHAVPINGSAQAWGTTSNGLLRFLNRRAELHWRLREALDPQNPEPIALPPDDQLAVDLAAPTWKLTKQGIQVESKDDIKKRLGRSPDRGDAIVLANITTPKRQMVLGPLLGVQHPHASEDYEQRRLRELEG